MRFKTLTISRKDLLYGVCVEGITDKNEFYQFFQNQLISELIEEKSHTECYNSIKRRYKLNKDYCFKENILVEDFIMNLLETKEEENVTLAVELIKNKKDGF